MWLDAARVIAICGVVALHTSVDSDGRPFPAADPRARAFPVLFRTAAEVASPEFFILMSLFLLAVRLGREDVTYGAVVGRQARRLLPPFLFWTALYAAWRYALAAEFGLDAGFIGECWRPSAWLGFILLGTVQFHMYFLPTLFALTLLYPCYRIALRQPWAALLVVPMLYAKEQLWLWLWGQVSEPVLRDYLLQLVRIVTYGGYGLAAFGLFAVWRRGLSRADARDLRRLAALCFAVAFAAELAYAVAVIRTGKVAGPEGLFFHARFLLPVILLAWFLGGQHLAWSPFWTRLAPYGYGVYLLHPALMDVWEVTLEPLRARPTLYVLGKFAFTLGTTFALVLTIARVRGLAWTVGLRPGPPGRRWPALTWGRAAGSPGRPPA